MRKKKQPSVLGLPCIHVRVPKRGKMIQAEIIEPSSKKVLWEKQYPKGTDLELIIQEARLFKPVSRIVEPDTIPVFQVLNSKRLRDLVAA